MTPQLAPIRHDPTGPAQVTIKTDRLILRPMQRADMGLIEQWASDRSIASMTTSIPHPLPPGTTDAFVTRVLSGTAGDVVWVMDASGTGLASVVGVISLTPMDRNQSEVAGWVAPICWKKGLASEAVQALIAANPLNSAQIFGCVFQDNPASARVLTNAGFDYIGDAEAFSVARGAVVPQWTYMRQMDQGNRT